ncbi:MAG: phage baseplate assembly protein V [Candidatus Manganitrophus sp.]|nr:phage baseplate assembly protein V [Candidatus Manganitrophus morganii]WDT73714.1 MAG: phage baseplate assembly protein V [Candidatus Manganitrophus sp.]WDT78274.1 MAG: phage baseplate assembly protein V [Candidatus Manganitrophus sp.]
MDERMARYVERAEGKYWGKYRGFVQDNNDPEQLGRLKVTVPSLLADAVSGWAWPAVPYAGAGIGFFFMPQVGDLVWVEFIEGELDHPLWTGCSWGKPGGQSELPEEALQSYPQQQVIKTPSGNVIIINDSSGSESITVRTKEGTEIVIDRSGQKITIQADSVIAQGSSEMPEELATKTFVQTIFDTHTHPSGVGPTGPPLVLSTTNPKSITRVLKAE